MKPIDLHVKSITLLLLVTLLGATELQAQNTRKPNFVVVLVDDMGWRDMGWSGGSFAETPRTDALARQGVIFRQAYASAPNCAPTRACLMSGQYTPRHGVYTVADERHKPGSPHHRLISIETATSLPEGSDSLPAALQRGGYATGGFGMWNLGRGRRGPGAPTSQGFDRFLRPKDVGFDNNRYFSGDGTNGEFLTDRLTDEAIDFIEENRKQPFFVYLATHSIHAPFEPEPSLLLKYRKKAEVTDQVGDPAWAAMVESLDRNVGRLMDRLAELKLDRDTVLIFTSDNGGTRQFTAPMRGGKGQLYEGGLRVPAMICWSGIRKPGREVDTPMTTIDLFPTCLDLAGLKARNDHALDGISLAPILANRQPAARADLFWHFPCYVGRNGPSSAIRSGNWKLIEHFEGDRVELYDLDRDPEESRDLSKIENHRVEDLHARLIAWRKNLKAAIPSGVNPAFDPDARLQRGRGAPQTRGRGQGERRGLRQGEPRERGRRGRERRGADADRAPELALTGRKSLASGDEPPSAARAFLPFKDRLKLSWDNKWLYVESDGLPRHQMMVGIRAWNQQVPLPQPYTGANAFRIPLEPEIADETISAKTNLFKGSIALAINGVPIFNPIKQDGRTDTYLAGELDEFGGHAGRADDYHYHVAPFHLQKAAGKRGPIAVALDGFPLLGPREPNGRQPKGLDGVHGHDHAHPHGASIPHTHEPDGTTHYHYHASKSYPYVNGGLRGRVEIENGEVKDQPRARPVRPFTRPLRGARIVDFAKESDGRHLLTYTLGGKRHQIRYGLEGERARFEFIDPNGEIREESHDISRGRQGGNRAAPERRGGRDRERRGRRRGPGRDRPDQNGARKPWIEVHASEMDSDKDGRLTRKEVLAESNRAFAAYDKNDDLDIDASECKQRVRGAMGGFIREHFTELDRDNGGSVTASELHRTALRMFEKADSDSDGVVIVPKKTTEQPSRRRESPRQVEPKPKRPSPQPPTGKSRPRPNIIFMMSDDQAWNGTSVPMHPDVAGSKNRFVQTPQLERLAANGMRFSAAYASAPVCSPTRISIQTGRSPAALHWTKAARGVTADQGYKLLPPRNIRAIPDREQTIGEILQAAGYRTAHFGKWHISGGGPGAHGYDVHDGDLGNEYAAKFKDPNPVDIFGMTDRATAFMKESKKSKKPFYIQMSWHALHSPENALKKTLEKYSDLMGDRGGNSKRLSRAAIAEDLDTGVGRLMDALDSLGLTDKTYVIYMSDNGGGGGGSGRRKGRRGRGASPLSGGKGSLSEGGIRVPFIIRGPGINANSWCHVPITGLDLLPTFSEWAGVKQLPKTIEGGSFASLLSSPGQNTVKRTRDEIVFHFPHYQDAKGPQSAIRVGDLKLLKYYEDDHVTLFDLSKDLGETRDLSSEKPKVAAAMKKQLEGYLTHVKAQLPTANPQYDPSKPPTPRRQRRNRR